MFAFRIWSKFGCFKDPLTVSQTLTLGIPPKTTVGGMLGAVVGLSNGTDGRKAYFEDGDYFSFRYSVCIDGAIRKKSFAQNYIDDYTKKIQTKLNDMSKNTLRDFGCSPKPIFRELLLNPSYLILVENYKYEAEALKRLQERELVFPLYGSFEWVDVAGFEEKTEDAAIHSFITDPESIDFTKNRKYTSVRFATHVSGKREYGPFASVVTVENSLHEPVSCRDVAHTVVSTAIGSLACQFL